MVLLQWDGEERKREREGLTLPADIWDMIAAVEAHVLTGTPYPTAGARFANFERLSEIRTFLRPPSPF